MFAWLIPLLIFVAVFLLAQDLLRRLQAGRLQREAVAVGSQVAGSAVAAPGPRRKEPLVDLFFRTLPVLAGWQVRWVAPAWERELRKKLVYYPRWAQRSGAEWLAAKELSLLGGLLLGWLLGAGWLASLALGAAAFFLPDLWLREQDQLRRRKTLQELPSALDLLASCMEAGLNFEQAVGVFMERGRRGYLAVEFRELLRAIQMGQARRDALEAMAQRVDDPTFGTFVTSLIQAERLGVSVAATLKNQAAQLRTKRSQEIEKQALEAPVKLLFPLILFIFPVVFLVLFGPIIIRLLQGM
ncbi:MAG: type II secretion system F family protein [candidate division FCPU426 bacterium]